MKNIDILPKNRITALTPSAVHTEKFLFQSGDFCPEHGHEFLEIGITFSGLATHIVKGKSSTLSAGTLYLIPIGTTHQISDITQWEVRNIYLLPTIFSAQFLNKDFSSYYNLQYFLMKYCFNGTDGLQFTLKENTLATIKSIFSLNDRAVFSDTDSFTAYQNNYIINILLLLIEDFYSQYGKDNIYHDPRLMKLNTFIQEHLDEPLNELISHLSIAFSLNSQYINRMIKKSIGIPISKYIIQCKIEKSIQLLRTNMSATDIACSLGFYDYSHFHKSFTQCTGISPGQFKRMK